MFFFLKNNIIPTFHIYSPIYWLSAKRSILSSAHLAEKKRKENATWHLFSCHTHWNITHLSAQKIGCQNEKATCLHIIFMWDLCLLPISHRPNIVHLQIPLWEIHVFRLCFGKLLLHFTSSSFSHPAMDGSAQSLAALLIIWISDGVYIAPHRWLWILNVVVLYCFGSWKSQVIFS